MIRRETIIGDGAVRLLLGDSLQALPTLPDGSVDAVVTDPPYSSGGQFRGDRMASTRAKYQSTDVKTEFASFSGDNRDQRAFAYWVALWAGELRRICVGGGMLCQFTDWRQLPSTTDAIQSGGWLWRGIVPWDKVVARPMPNRFRSQCEYIVWGTNGARDFAMGDDAVYGDGFIKVATTPTAEREHSTQKPIELMERVIAVACPSSGTVIDPFMGSGTTIVAAIRTGRKAVGVELNEEYYDIAVRRCREAWGDDSLFQQAAAEPKQLALC